MTTPTAQADLQTVRAVDRADWRMDPPPPGDLLDLLHGAWPGALVAMLLLALLLGFGSVVSDGVRRGEQLRHQMASADWRCDAVGPHPTSLSCTRPGPSARLQSAESSMALNQTQLPPMPARQE